MLSTPRSHPVQRNLWILGNLFSWVLRRASPIWVTIAKRKWNQIGILFIQKKIKNAKYTVSFRFSRNFEYQIYLCRYIKRYIDYYALFQTKVKLLLYTVMLVDNNNLNTIIRIKIFGNYIPETFAKTRQIFPPKSPISPLCLHYTEIK